MGVQPPSLAISCMWAWMIPHFYIEFTEYRLALAKASPENGETSASNSAREKANSSTVQGVCWAIGIIGIVYSGSALIIGMLTAQPNQTVLTKADAIAVGVGRMLSAALLAYFSVEFPKWLGVSYSSQKRVECYKHVTLILDEESSSAAAIVAGANKSKNNHRELSFRVCWSLLGRFFVLYPCLLAYFCHESIAHVALSTLVGISCGFAVVYFMWLSHTKLNRKSRTGLAIILSLLIALSSAGAFSAGCWYVKKVWLDSEDATPEYAAVTFFVWFFLCLLVHSGLLHLTRRKLAEAKVAKAVLQQHSIDHDTVDASESPSESLKEEWRYTSQVFQPPKSIFCVAIEFTKSFSSLPTLRKIGRKKQKEQDQHSILDNTKKEGNTRVSANNPQLGLESHLEKQNSGNEAIIDEGNRQVDFSTAVSNVETPDLTNPISEDELLACPSDHPIIHDLSVDAEGEENLPARPIEERKSPTLWSMIRNNSCCRRRKHYQAPSRKGWSKLATIIKWTLWMLVCIWHVSFTIVNIGANVQRNKVRSTLSGTFAKLYPDNYITGAMCAWNEASPSADIRTFGSLQDVLDANYTVIHCGECGYCSNWNDLSLQWTTRHHLAQRAKNCVAKSILGSREDVQTCTEESIGFTEDCALCWTEDGYCARDNCMFLFLQSVFTNQVNNFSVGPDDITTATCDEALCGPDFVPCSGATRRRMNIVSDIPRPISQQCGVAGEDWSFVFDHP